MRRFVVKEWNAVLLFNTFRKLIPEERYALWVTELPVIHLVIALKWKFFLNWAFIEETLRGRVNFSHSTVHYNMNCMFWVNENCLSNFEGVFLKFNLCLTLGFICHFDDPPPPPVICILKLFHFIAVSSFSLFISPFHVNASRRFKKSAVFC